MNEKQTSKKMRIEKWKIESSERKKKQLVKFFC